MSTPARFLRSSYTALRTTTPISTTRSILASRRQFHASSPKMVVHNIATMEQFKETIAKGDVVLIDAFATWCGPCKAIAPQIAKWSEGDFKDKIHFAKFDVDALPGLAQELGVRAMPTFYIFKDGEKVDAFMGANPQPLEKLLQKYAPSE
ncbi:thioredoxin [Diplogelasinospora grovesii]|uniref:Thioredoxin n=1 Tax=Diplogelasinospora grovesii TaxID=303347 RepID=A0AAN6NDQ5_9PEZI|nr:thioredoxin [Diplogelasinospora grovesii]